MNAFLSHQMYPQNSEGTCAWHFMLGEKEEAELKKISVCFVGHQITESFTLYFPLEQ